MKPQLSVIVFFTLLFFVSINLSAQKIYISPDGNDSNPGTTDKPRATLTGARDRVREMRKNGQVSGPVEVIALQGEYAMMQPLELTIEDSGTKQSPLVFRSEEGQKATFTAGVPITGFSRVNDKLWKAFIPQTAYYNWYFEQLFVNGKRAIRARTPNDSFGKVIKLEETIIEKGTGRIPPVAVQKVFLDSSLVTGFSGFTDRDYEDAIMIFYHNWDNTRKRIMSFEKNQSAIFIAGEGMKPWNPINAKSRWYAENFMGALDAPGEWFLERSGWLYYIPKEGETIENTKFTAPLLDRFITIRGDETSGKRVEYISFRDLNFRISAYNTPPSGNEPAQAAAPVNAVITADFADNISFSDCEISNTGTYAFWFRRAVSNCLVTRCYLHDLGAGGIKIGETVLRPSVNEISNNITVDNNIITDAGHIFPCAVGIIIFHGSDNRLTHNEISDLRYSGVSVGWIWGYAPSPSKRNLVAYNHIHHLGWGELCDMGGVYTLGASEGTVVSNNVIHHVHSFDYGGWGLYTDEGSYGIVMENNLVYNCKNSGFHQHYGKENIIRNNIFAFNLRGQLQATRIEEHRSLSFTNNIIYFDKGSLMINNWHKFNLLTDYNCYWDTRSSDIKFGDKSFSEWQKSGRDQHSLIADPLFMDPSAFDFRFKKLSVAKKIKFTPFDYSEAGVYGSEEWKKLALIDHTLEKEFDAIVLKTEAGKPAR
jgi:parallel beta-helix repeat protein